MTNNIAPNWSTEITLTSPNKTTKNGCSEVKASASNAGEPGSIPGLGRSPGEGNGNPLLYSCLENPMDWGAWWAAVHRVTKSRTRLSDLTYLLTYLCSNSMSPSPETMCSWHELVQEELYKSLRFFLLWTEGEVIIILMFVHNMSFILTYTWT